MSDTNVTYDTLRQLAGTWGLVVMVVGFVVCILWPFRPGSNTSNQAAATMIFEEDDNG